MGWPEDMDHRGATSPEDRAARREMRKAEVRARMAAAAPAGRVKHKEVERVVETVREVPVDRVVEVEKVVYRDRPVPPEALARMEAAKAAIDNREPVAASVPAELVQHVNEGETVPEVKQRFLRLYSDLGNKVQMGIASKAESRLHESLHAQMNWIVSD